MENIFIILLGLSMIYIASTSRLAAHVNMLVAQGWLLFMVCFAGFAKEPWFDFAIFTSKEAFLANSGCVLMIWNTFLVFLSAPPIKSGAVSK